MVFGRFRFFQDTTERDDREMQISQRMGGLSISKIKNNLRYRFAIDLNLIGEDTLIKSFQTIKPLHDKDTQKGQEPIKKHNK